MTVEFIRGDADAHWSERLVRFWTGHGALSEAAARERAPHVACVVLDDGGEIAGTCSATAADVGPIGGLPFWVLRSFLPAAAANALPELVATTFDALAAGFDPSAGGPLGLCVVIAPADVERHPAAEWADPRTVYAGRLDDGSQLRVAYFDGAVVRPRAGSVRSFAGRDHDRGASIELFADQSAVTAQDVVGLWVREGAMPAEEAARRVDELLLVAIDDGRPVGAATAYVAHDQRLAMPMWHGRVFVAASERRRGTGFRLGLGARDVLAERFHDGRDTRACGVLFEIQSEAWRRFTPEAHWPVIDFTFIGLTDRGGDLRVHWFDGARIPA